MENEDIQSIEEKIGDLLMKLNIIQAEVVQLEKQRRRLINLHEDSKSNTKNPAFAHPQFA